MTTTAASLVARAKSEIRNLTVEQLAQRLESGPVTLIDLREPQEVRREGAIPGAVAAPRGMLEFWADPASPYHRAEFDPAAPTVLYCAGGARSALAAQTLVTLGYTDVAHLEGGLTAWTEQGRPVTRATALGERFARALLAKDRDALRSLLADDLDFQGLTASRPWQASSAEQAIDDIILGCWFEPSDHLEELSEVTTGRVNDREHVAYRILVRNATGEFLVEQQVYYGHDAGRINWMRVLCSGFRPMTSGS